MTPMPSKLKLSHLEVFAALIETGSITRAATRLHLTQPAVSKQLAALEEVVGLRLFNRRSGAQLLPTSEGVKFFKSIENTLAHIKLIPEIAKGIAERRRTSLRIAATYTMMNSPQLLEALSELKVLFPDLHVALETRHRLDIEDCILRRQIDLALAVLPADHPEIETHSLIRTPAAILMRPDHRLAQRDWLSQADLEQETIVLPNRQPLRNRLDLDFDWETIPHGKIIECSSAVARCRMASQGIGVTFSDAFAASVLPEVNLVAVEWRPRIEMNYGLFVAEAGDDEPILKGAIAAIVRSFRRWNGRP
jgi:DNA-binding transcriptional LysR family regulator